MADAKKGPNREGGRDARGRFKPGAGGRPRGARNKTTRAVEAMLDGQAEGLAAKALELAMGGDASMVRVLLDRVAPARRERPIVIPFPAITCAADLAKGAAAVLEAVARGELTSGEAAALSQVLERSAAAFETSELAARVARLEQGFDHGAT